MRKILASLFCVAIIAACDSDDVTVPVAVAGPSRHDELRAAIEDDARAFSFQAGDWLEDYDDAPFFGPAWLSRKAPLDADETTRRDAALARARTLLAGDFASGDVEEKVMAALGLIESIGVTQAANDIALVDTFVDHLDAFSSSLGDYLDGAAAQSPAIRAYGATAVTALVGLVFAQYALLVGGDLAKSRQDRAVAIDHAIEGRAFGDLGYSPKAASVRAFAADPDDASLDLFPNVAMIILEGRLFRLTKDEAYRLETRATYGAIQPLKVSDVPARYASPADAALFAPQSTNVASLSSQNYLALALLVLFEITGENHFVDEADRVLDAIATMRGPWCLAQAHTEACAPACVSGQACVASACTADRCASGLLHHEVDGNLAAPTDPTFFCSGCNWQTLYVIGYRRSLANQDW